MGVALHTPMLKNWQQTAQIIYQDLFISFVILTTNGHQKRQIVQHLLVYRLAIKQVILENQRTKEREENYPGVLGDASWLASIT